MNNLKRADRPRLACCCLERNEVLTVESKESTCAYATPTGQHDVDLGDQRYSPSRRWIRVRKLEEHIARIRHHAIRRMLSWRRGGTYLQSSCQDWKSAAESKKNRIHASY